MTKRIALIGSAPSSVALAPYDDPTWTIWSCSPGARPHLKRVDAHYELHLWEPDQSWFAPEYVDFMAKLPCPVIMLEPVEAIPGSVAYPKNEIMDLFGPAAVYFYTSSLSWMMALAIAQNPDEIGLWGVDMSAAEELYTGQRAGCQYWIGLARSRGIKVTLPPQSDLAQPTPLYGFCEQKHEHQKLLARKAELVARLNGLRASINAQTQEATYLQGAAEDVDYILKTWVSDPKATELLARFDTHVGLPKTAPPVVAPEPTPAEDPASRLTDALRGVAGAMRAADVQPHQIDMLMTGTGPRATWESTPTPQYINGANG